LQGIFLTFMEEGDAMQMTQVFRKHYLKAQEKGIPLMQGAAEMLKKLKKDGKKVGIVTMKLAEFAQSLCEDLKIAKYIDVIIGGEDVEHGKPHPEGLLKAMKQLGVKKEETVFVGDSLYDAEAAKEAGIDFIGATTGTATEKDLKAFGVTKIVRSMLEL